MTSEFRVKNSIFNSFSGFAGQLLSIILQFLVRTVFIHSLGLEYLGLNGLFANVLTLLSLSELGVGKAIIVNLYEPIAQNDKEKILSLMQFYKKAYNVIGIFIITVGISLTPIIPLLIKNVAVEVNIRFVYICFLLDSATTYFYSYYGAYIIANQKQYYTVFYHYLWRFINLIAQAIILIIFSDYYLYLLIMLLTNVGENINMVLVAKRLYPILKIKEKFKLAKSTAESIKKNVIALLCHQIGSIVVFSTDNILLSAMFGLRYTGLYANYILFSKTVDGLINSLFDPLTATIGNLHAEVEKQRQYDVYKILFFAQFVFYSISGIILVNLIEPFIVLWLGSDFLMQRGFVYVLILNFFITGMRKVTISYNYAFELQKNYKIMPLMESIVNLSSSIILARLFGPIGIFVGTTVSSITGPFWIEPYILYKKGFDRPVIDYFKIYSRYIILTVGFGLIVELSATIPEIYIKNEIIKFISKMIIALVIPTTGIIVLFRNTYEYRYLMDTLRKIFSFMVKNKIEGKKESV